MPTLKLSLVQDVPVEIEVPQGVAFEIGLDWHQEAENSTPQNPVTEPIDNFEDFTFLAQVRTDTREADGELVKGFSLTPDAFGSKYSIDLAAGSTWFYFSDELSVELMKKEKCFFEVKMINASGNPVEKIVMKLVSVADYAH